MKPIEREVESDDLLLNFGDAPASVDASLLKKVSPTAIGDILKTVWYGQAAPGQIPHARYMRFKVQFPDSSGGIGRMWVAPFKTRAPAGAWPVCIAARFLHGSGRTKFLSGSW